MHDEMPNAIAIIGMAGRFPGARDLEEFWHLLEGGVEAISFFTREELEEAGVPREVIDHPRYVPARGVLDGVESMDADFFGITPREAELMDPQQRLFLECAFEALEAAGYGGDDPGAVGVYAGLSLNSYLLSNVLPSVGSGVDEMQALLGSDKDFLPTRVSYKLNLRGPSINVNTACSSALVAVHLACQSLLSAECDMALAGSASIAVPQVAGYLYQEGGILSPDGHCRAFDARAAGTVKGSGLGVLVLKRLEDALADGDPVRAVLRGSAVNNDGGVKVGFTAPGLRGQVEVIEEAMRMSGVEPDSIDYVETHGTGTSLGDPIEISALQQAYARLGGGRRLDGTSCALGSLKTNVGHLDAAAGMGGLIKTVLAMEQEHIPPSLHFETPHPEIDLEASSFHVNADLTAWPRGSRPRRAGVSSFGIGGTNAHVVLEEAPHPTPSVSASTDSKQLLVLSARTSTALDRASSNLTTFLRQEPEANLADVAYTLGMGRRRFDHRRALVAASPEEAADLLEAGEGATVEDATRQRPVAFLFPGQGVHYGGMGRGLYGSAPAFREAADRCAALLRPHLDQDLRELCGWTSPEGKVAPKLERPLDLQAATFTVEYALAQLWLDWGIEPRGMIGHSLGEYVAACVAGVLSLGDALSLVVARSRLMAALPAGAMLALDLDEDTLRDLLPSDLDIAAVNGPNQTVVSGPEEAITAFEEQLTAHRLVGRRLTTSHAFHSSMLDSILDPFARAVAKVTLSAPERPYLSNVTGTWARPEDVQTVDYWVRHLRGTVRFGAGLHELSGDGERAFLELGPGRTLTALVRRLPGRQGPAVSAMPSVRDQRDDETVLLEALGELWLSGVEVDWRQIHGGLPRRRLALPTYPFERRRYWIDPPTRTESARIPAVDATSAFGAAPQLAMRLGGRTWMAELAPPNPEQQHSPSETAQSATLPATGRFLMVDGQGTGPHWLAGLARAVDQPRVVLWRETSVFGAAAEEVPTQAWDPDAEKLLPRLTKEEADISQRVEIPTPPEGLVEANRELCTSQVHSFLAAAGVDMTPGTVHRVDDLHRHLRVLPKFRKFFDFLLRILVEDGVAELDGERLTVGTQTVRDPQVVEREVVERFPDFRRGFELIDHCVAHYPAALSGEIEAISVLYPDGSPDMIKPIQDETSRFSNLEITRTLTVETVVRLARQADRPLRILEVGGGDGNLTWHMVEALREFDVEYHFTDLGKAFVLRAEERAREKGLDFMEFGVLDISQDPVAQGFPRHGFDIVLAFNVVHATPDIRTTLGQLSALLTENGLLGLLEASHSPRWGTMIWGLAEGWWYFEDEDIRQDSPMMPAETWKRLLVEEGFRSVETFPSGSAGSRADTALILAQQGEEVVREIDPKIALKAFQPRELRRLRRLEAEVELAEGSSEELRALYATEEWAGVIALVPEGEGGWGLEDVIAPTVLVKPWDPGSQPLDRALQEGGGDGAIEVLWDHRLDEGPSAPHWVAQALPALWALEGPQRVAVTAGGDGLRGAGPQGDGTSVAPSTGVDPGQGSAPSAGRTGHPRPSLKTPFLEPRNPKEAMVANLWQEVFGLDRVGVEDDFHELGGDSLLATQIATRLGDLLGTEVAVRTVLEAASVARLCSTLEEERGGPNTHGTPSAGSRDLVSTAIRPVSRDAYRAQRSTVDKRSVPAAPQLSPSGDSLD